MAIYLAIDASAESCSVTTVNGTVRRTCSSVIPRSHAQQLLPFIDDLLRIQQISPPQLEFISCCQGPGSFTGLRIGMGVAQGLAYAIQVPLVGVCSLAAMAANTRRLVTANIDWAITLLDARMGEIYWAVYDLSAPDPVAVVEPALLGVADLATLLRAFLAENVHRHLAIVGAAVQLLPFTAEELARLTVDTNIVPDSNGVAELALLKWQAGAALAPSQFELVYLRNSVSWNKRQRIRS